MNFKTYLKNRLPASFQVASRNSKLSVTCFHLKMRLLRRFVKAQVNLVGANNTVNISKSTVLENSEIWIHGNNNTLRIGDNCRLTHAKIEILSNHSQITIGDKTNILGSYLGDTYLLAKGDTTSITIGNDCLLSYGIHIRTTDSHSIVCQNTGALLNPPCDIKIGDHVWIGARSTLLKGSSIGNGSVIGACSLTNDKIGSNVLAAGQPAKALRHSIAWKPDIPQISPLSG